MYPVVVVPLCKRDFQLPTETPGQSVITTRKDHWDLLKREYPPDYPQMMFECRLSISPIKRAAFVISAGGGEMSTRQQACHKPS